MMNSYCWLQTSGEDVNGFLKISTVGKQSPRFDFTDHKKQPKISPKISLPTLIQIKLSVHISLYAWVCSHESKLYFFHHCNTCEAFCWKRLDTHAVNTVTLLHYTVKLCHIIPTEIYYYSLPKLLTRKKESFIVSCRLASSKLTHSSSSALCESESYHKNKQNTS